MEQSGSADQFRRFVREATGGNPAPRALALFAISPQQFVFESVTLARKRIDVEHEFLPIEGICWLFDHADEAMPTIERERDDLLQVVFPPCAVRKVSPRPVVRVKTAV